MRPSALISVIFGLVAFVLSMLCIFAGSKKGFMEDYAIVTLNTSRIGENIIDSTASSSSSSSSNPISSWFHNLTSSIGTQVNDDIGSLAHTLGIHDFYSAHLLDYCEGYYTPSALPNSTLKPGDITQNVTYCSNSTAFYQFNPAQALQRELSNSGLDIDLDDLHWPDAITKGLSALNIAQKAAFILYCIAAGILAVATLAAVVSVFLNGHLSASVDVLLWGLAFFATMLASAVVTAIAVKAARVINESGSVVGISAERGDKFLIITWVATGLAFLNVLVWAVEVAVGRRRRRRNGQMLLGEK